MCDGKKGLLTRLLTVMKKEPPDSSFRWDTGFITVCLKVFCNATWVTGTSPIFSLKILAGQSCWELSERSHIICRPDVSAEERLAGGEDVLIQHIKVSVFGSQNWMSHSNVVLWLQHILFCIIDSGCKSRDVLQSYFDLLGELMKFNIDAFKRFNKYVNTDEKVLVDAVEK